MLSIAITSRRLYHHYLLLSNIFWTAIQRQNEAYNKFCEDNKLKRLAERIEVAKWTRADAKKSMMAVRENPAKKALANSAGRGIMRTMGENEGLTAEQARKATPHEETYGADAVRVDLDYVRSNEYRMKFHGITGSAVVDDRIAEQCRDILESRTGTYKETLVILDADKGSLLTKITDSPGDNQIVYDDKVLEAIQSARNRGHRLLSIHNHPEGYPPTADDCVSAYHRGYSFGVVCGHNGAVYTYEPSNAPLSNDDCIRIHNNIAYQCQFENALAKRIDLWIEMMREIGFSVRKWG